jgi:hypothetical protein
MQPPRPGKPEPRSTLGEASRSPSSPERHPQSPSDLFFMQGTARDTHLVGTRDPSLVRAWAEHHGAEPATGEQTSSGPATVNVNDQGTGLRFNFPAASRFRPVSWDEWIVLFEDAGFVFVYESECEPEQSALTRFGGAFYRLVPAAQWGDQPLATLAS